MPTNSGTGRVSLAVPFRLVTASTLATEPTEPGAPFCARQLDPRAFLQPSQHQGCIVCNPEVVEPRVIGRRGALHLQVRLERGRHIQYEPLTAENLVSAEPYRKAVAPVGDDGNGLAGQSGAMLRDGLPLRCPEHLCRRPGD